jgi:hypothetical protein
VDLWEDEEQFTLVFTSPDLRAVQRFGHRQVHNAMGGGDSAYDDPAEIIAYFQSSLWEAGHGPARTPAEPGGIAAWILTIS